MKGTSFEPEVIASERRFMPAEKSNSAMALSLIQKSLSNYLQTGAV
jgi:hypothetical protein